MYGLCLRLMLFRRRVKKDEEEDTTDEEEDIDEEGLEDLDLEEGEEGMGSRTIQVANPLLLLSCVI